MEYQMEIKCRNCKRTNWIIKIPIGLTVKDFCLNEEKTCIICGCYLFKKEEEKKEDEDDK